MSIFCAECGRMALRAEWARVMLRVPVAHAGRIVGYVTVLRHRDCGDSTAVPVRASAPGV